MGEKRSGGDGFAQGDLFGEASAAGVGGRQGRGVRQAGGGGYLKNCGFPNFQIPDVHDDDPRFAELIKIGIGGPWLRLARRVGFDVFLEIWREICEDEGTRHDGGRRMPKLREIRAYERYQRNQYIRTLAAAGVEIPDIRKLVEKNSGERLSVTLIQKVSRGSYDRAWSNPDEANDDEENAAG